MSWGGGAGGGNGGEGKSGRASGCPVGGEGSLLWTQAGLRAGGEGTGVGSG